MTGKSRSARTSFLTAILVLGLAACGTAQASKAADSAENTVQSASAPKSSATDLRAEMSAAETIDGTIVLVSVKLGEALEGKPVTGEFDGIDLPFYKDGELHRAVLGVPYDHKAGPAIVKVRVGQGAEQRVTEATFVVKAGEYTSETLKVDGRRVQPQNPKDLKRIKAEMAEIGLVYSTVTPRKYWTGPFALPVEQKIKAVTSSFGTKRVYNGVQKSAHLGLDFKAPSGTPIAAAAAGKVVLAKNLFFTGNTVILDHGYGVLTLYAHMSKLQVRKGQEVAVGSRLGLSGMTGRVTGPHLHWMAIIHKQKVNPLGLTQVMR